MTIPGKDSVTPLKIKKELRVSELTWFEWTTSRHLFSAACALSASAIVLACTFHLILWIFTSAWYSAVPTDA